MIKKTLLGTSLLLGGIMATQTATAQIFSFENGKVPAEWKIDKGSLQITDQKYKGGKHALQITWKQGANLSIPCEKQLAQAVKGKNGGMNVWIYNTQPTDEPMTFSFRDKTGQKLCKLDFKLNFKGWRCIWNRFHKDMNLPKKAAITSLVIAFPQSTTEGETYIDLLDFNKNVSWQAMPDAHYYVNQTDFSLIPDFNGYRRTAPHANPIITATQQDIDLINQRLTAWYLGNGNASESQWVKRRADEETNFIKQGLKQANKIKVRYAEDGTAIGYPLFPMGAPNNIDGEEIQRFRTVNEKMLLPLALDYRKNHNKQSLEKALFIYDWFNDQGWADGSGLGTLTFEKLRSAGYFHSFYLLKDELTPAQYERELKAMQWFTLFGTCYQPATHNGEVADNLRALALPKLIYALSLKDKEAREVALSAYKTYMEHALGIAPGYFGTFKADFSGYHHRGPYNSAYYPHALYAGALVAYLLHDTPYALNETTLRNLKQGLLTFRFFSANLEIPAGTVGRFPKNQQILETLLPAFAYVALCSEQPDPELTAAYKRIAERKENQKAIEAYMDNVNSNLNYTATVGEAELMQRLSNNNSIAAENAPQGSLFMPYSGLLVTKDSKLHFNMKGFSRYIWDFESSASENLQGRYLAYGQLEYFDLETGKKSFNPREENFDWRYIPGATTKVLPQELLQNKGGASSGHRSFSDETFLAGISSQSDNAMFAFRLHDITYDKSLRANKSVFVGKDFLLCLGSDIQSTDAKYPMVTTLFQSFDGKANQERVNEGYILEDATVMYAVKGGAVRSKTDGAYTCAYIEHGFAPQGAKYGYYILKQKDKKLARKLLSKKSPINIEMQNNDAHIVSDKENHIVYAAIFNADKVYENMTVKQVNIPLAYMIEKLESNKLHLSICEPDMRRAQVDHMGLLTEADVLIEERANDTQIALKGHFQVTGTAPALKTLYDQTNNQTIINLSTIRGENYDLELTKMK